MKVLIAGSGGREHAIAWKLKTQNPDIELFTAPGNPGTAKLGKNIPISADTLEGLLVLAEFAEAMGIDLTIVGPEMPLALGIVDIFEMWGLKIFGPSKKAAQIEASKVFAKSLMVRQSIPTAGVYRIFPDFESLVSWLDDRNVTPPYFPMVLKANGLAAGKGVQVCHDFEQAREFAEAVFVKKLFGDDIGPVMVEEFLSGPELSLLAFVDGGRVVPMLAARDYKPVFDGNRGPNTGGMGSYAPVAEISANDIQALAQQVLIPAVQGLAEIDRPYKGVLYAGLMLTDAGPKVLEFNCRFGDPETQPLMMLLKSNLLELLVGCVDGNLEEESLQWETGAAVCVVAASEGYPGHYVKGIPIYGWLEERRDLVVFHAGTGKIGDRLITAGGRVLGVTARGEDLWKARGRAYAALRNITFEGMHYRTDIGLERNPTGKTPPRGNPSGSNSKTRRVKESAREET